MRMSHRYKENKVELSIVIINHNTEDIIRETIRSIRNTVDIEDYEIVVVDNSPEEKMERDLADIFVRAENHGFAHACNLGARCSMGAYLLFLNPDVILGQNAVRGCLDYLKEHTATGIVGIRTLLHDGTLDGGCKRGFPTPLASLCYFLKLDKIFPKSRVAGRYHMTYLPDDQIQEVESVSGAFLLMPRKVFDELGGWDERFFMYGEDIDLCYRAKMAGYSVIYFGEASVLHKKGSSVKHDNKQRVNRHFFESMQIFYDKHYKQKYSKFTTWMVYRGIAYKQRKNAR